MIGTFFSPVWTGSSSIYKKHVRPTLPRSSKIIQSSQEGLHPQNIWYPLVMTNSLLLNMAIYSGFSHEKWIFSIVMLVYQRVSVQIILSLSWYLVAGNHTTCFFSNGATNFKMLPAGNRSQRDWQQTRKGSLAPRKGPPGLWDPIGWELLPSGKLLLQRHNDLWDPIGSKDVVIRNHFHKKVKKINISTDL